MGLIHPGIEVSGALGCCRRMMQVSSLEWPPVSEIEGTQPMITAVCVSFLLSCVVSGVGEGAISRFLVESKNWATFP